MKVSTNAGDWFRVFIWAAMAVYFLFWRIKVQRRSGEPERGMDRSIRIVLAIITTVMTLIYLAHGIGLTSSGGR